MLRGLVTALRTLTAVRIPGRDAESLADSLPWFPVVGGLIGVTLVLAARLSLSASQSWTDGASVVTLAVGVLLTRALHLDGLADWADGFGGSRNRERVLEIMKDPRTGTFGVISLIVILLAKLIGYSRIISAGSFHWMISACIVSRAIQVELAASLPYARTGGGTAQSFVSGAREWHRISSAAAALLLAAVCSGVAGTLLVACGWIAARVLATWFRRRVGGITGDLLGASSELVETGILLVCAATDLWLSRLTIWSAPWH
ncbi:MAG: adenosylcobinamide-GDP ribazoletransferase [Acidobacteriota bacterium]